MLRQLYAYCWCVLSFAIFSDVLLTVRRIQCSSCVPTSPTSTPTARHPVHVYEPNPTNFRFLWYRLGTAPLLFVAYCPWTLCAGCGHSRRSSSSRSCNAEYPCYPPELVVYKATTGRDVCQVEICTAACGQAGWNEHCDSTFKADLLRHERGSSVLFV